LALVVWGALQEYVATLGAELFLARTAFLISLAGAVLYLAGSAWLRRLMLPLALLCFMIPIPAIIYSQVTFPLQILASRAAESGLSALGLPVLREGNILELPNQKLNVIEACSGIRSLLSLSFLAVVYAHFFDERKWMKPVLLLASVPIAVAANAARVTLTGVLSEYAPALSEVFFHGAQGWVIFMMALAIMAVLHQAVRFIYRRIYERQ
jgi:exosortase